MTYQPVPVASHFEIKFLWLEPSLLPLDLCALRVEAKLLLMRQSLWEESTDSEVIGFGRLQ